MKASTKTIFVAITVLSGGVFLYALVNKHQPIDTRRSASAPAVSSSSTSGTKSGADQPRGNATAAPVGVSDYAAEFRSATNYHSFIRTALTAAEAGDRDAAYYLAAAITYCSDTHRFFFERKGKVLSVEEAIAERARLPGVSMTEAIRRADGRCHEVYEARNPPWGTADFWMARATDAGQPMAQLRTATAALLTINTKGAAGAPRVGKPDEVLNVDDARRLARFALESKDPEVIFEIADLLGMLRPDMPVNEAMKEMLVWKYAACLRGADCGNDAEWLFQACQVDTNCQRGMTGLDYLRNTASSMQMFDVEIRATVLNTKIDEQTEGAWNELGLSG